MSNFGEPIVSPAEPVLSAEQQTKSDQDIHTLARLRDYFVSQNIRYMLADGYAVEAHGGGKITRPHGDMDLYLLISAPDAIERLRNGITAILGHEQTNWQVHEVGGDGHSIEFREDVPGKTWEERRRLEVAFLESGFSTRTQTRILIDSQGNECTFEVEHVADLIAAKVIKLMHLSSLSKEEREKKGLRETRQRDKDEIKRLIDDSNLSNDKLIDAITEYIQRGNDSPISDSEAHRQAVEQWKLAMHLLQ